MDWEVSSKIEVLTEIPLWRRKNLEKPTNQMNNDDNVSIFLFDVYKKIKIYRHTLFETSKYHVAESIFRTCVLIKSLNVDQQLCVRSLSLDDLTVRSTWCPGKEDWDMHAGDVGFVSGAWQPEMLAEYKMFYMRIYIYIYVHIGI